MVQVFKLSTDFDFSHTAVDSHTDKVLIQPPTDENHHIDRIILALGHTGASADDVSKIRLYTMVDDVPDTDLAAGFPDDNDPNVWFKQVIYGGTPIYVSWRPKRTIRGGEILYVDSNAVQFAAAREVFGFFQAFYHKLG